MRNLVKAVFSAMIIMSSAPAKGEMRFNINQEILQITNPKGNGQVGKASFYGGKSHNGKKTASGERFNKNDMTCAHMSLPFGTKLRVTNLKTNKSVIVKVNDRGNFRKYNRVIDLSEGAFKKIASLEQGVVKVKIEIL